MLETRIIGGQKVPYVADEVLKINNTDLLVKEFNGQRVVTFKDIDMLHERVEGTSNKRFIDNKKHFIEDEDYFEIKGEILRQFKRLPNFGIGEKASKLILITESGYLMLVKSLQDDLAWKVQRELVNNYFRVKEVVQALDTSELSPELQMFNQMFKAIANNELEQKRLKAEIKEVKEEAKEVREEIQGIREAVTLEPNQWRKDTATLINKIANKLGGFEHIKPIRDEAYSLLNNTYGVDINRRLLNKKKNMALEGCSKSKIDKINYLDVIAEDKKLINGYINIVGRLAVKYGIKN